jgi:hypothetical protein
MERHTKRYAFVLALAALALVGCVEPPHDGEIVEEQSPLCLGLRIDHYEYEFEEVYYKADVTFNPANGVTYFDQKRIGGPRLPQHTVTPSWISCPAPNKNVVLHASGHIDHPAALVCMPGGDVEMHLASTDLPGNPPAQLYLNFLYTECL